MKWLFGKFHREINERYIYLFFIEIINCIFSLSHFQLVLNAHFYICSQYAIKPLEITTVFIWYYLANSFMVIKHFSSFSHQENQLKILKYVSVNCYNVIFTGYFSQYLWHKNTWSKTHEITARQIPEIT